VAKLIIQQPLITKGFAEQLQRAAPTETSAPPPKRKRMLRRSFLMSGTPGEEDASFAALQLLGWEHMTRPK
jgi:hypothetical protein